MGYHVNSLQCTKPNFLLTGQVYPMLMSSLPKYMGHPRQKKYPSKNDYKIFSEGRCFHVLA